MKLPTIYGFNKCSEMGEDIFAFSVFLKGCNLRCPYCINSKLFQGSLDLTSVSIEDIKKSVEEYDNKWMVISGGEPTCTDENLLINLISEFKSWGCKVSLSTNGTNPECMRSIVPSLNYVALDFKTDRFEKWMGCQQEPQQPNIPLFVNVLRTQCILAIEERSRKDFDYELRTTLYPPLINKKSLREIGKLLRKCDKWVLQQFRVVDNMPSSESHDVKPYDEETIREMLKVAQQFTSKAELRYV